jgi:hypothetical protein
VGGEFGEGPRLQRELADDLGTMLSIHEVECYARGTGDARSPWPKIIAGRPSMRAPGIFARAPSDFVFVCVET